MNNSFGPETKYQLRVSRRSRHVRLRIKLNGDLEVTVPRRYDPTHLHLILKNKQTWIVRARQRLEEIRNQRPAEEHEFPPRTLHIRAVNAVLPINYALWTGSQRIRIKEDMSVGLTITGALTNHAMLVHSLKRWLYLKAYSLLGRSLRILAYEYNVPVKRISIYGQKTRWASYSARHSFNLNFTLLFLPNHLVDYVLKHELCHANELNHSRKFWALLESRLPDCFQCDQQLRHAWHYVPSWLLPT